MGRDEVAPPGRSRPLHAEQKDDATAPPRSRQADAGQPTSDVLGLQRMAGNQAVRRWLRGGATGGGLLPVQRCGEKGCGGGSCGCAQEERDQAEVPAGAGPVAQREPEAAGGEAPPAGPADVVLVDDDQPVPPGGMRRTEFMESLRTRLFAMCDAELAAVGRTSEGCPYLTRWVDHYAEQPAARIERSIRLWTGEAATTPAALQDAVMSRVRGAVRTWVATGEVTGIPETAPELAASPASGAAAPPGGAPGSGDGAAPPPPGPPTAQRSTTSGPAPAASDAARVRRQLGAGSPLDAGVRSRLEPAFGQSFAGVRVHTGSDAAALADTRSMKAFTVGSDIVVGSDEYAPGTLAGDALLAHELAHTVQQGGDHDHDPAHAHDHGGPGGGPLPVQASGDEAALEHEADAAAAAALGAGLGLDPGAASPALSRQRGLRLQGCSQKAKACPVGYRWYPTATAQWGSFGCTCIWKCLREPPSARGGGSSGPSISCPPGVSCSDPYDRVAEDYTKTGYGAAFTPLTGEPACGCFPLDLEGNEKTDAPLVPVTVDMTNVVGPGADMAAGARARRRGGGGMGPQTDPLTGTRHPGGEPQLPHPVRTRMIEAGMYTANMARRLDPLFRQSDPAIMRALERTMDSFTGEARTARVRQLLDWAERRPGVPPTVEEGATFGEGGTGSVAEVVGRPDLASKAGYGRAGGEAAAMVELEMIGIPTVYLAEGRNQRGQTRLILRRIDGVGSKETIGRKGRAPDDPVQARENQQLITERTVSDLRRIRQILADNRMNLADFQFIIQRSDGAVFINDPTGFTPNSGPSGYIDDLIDRFAAIHRRRTSGSPPQ